MPLYVIERNLADQLDTAKFDFEEVAKANDIADVEWVFSFLSADRKKTYCLYEASSAEAIREAARLAGIPADEIIEVSELIRPEDHGLPSGSSEILGALAR